MPVRPVHRTLEEELANRRGQPVERSRTLPGHWYSDPDHHAVELDRVFGRHWIGIAGTDAVEKPGSYLTATVAGRVPVLVVRGDDGALRAFLNVCRPRGAPVAEGRGTARALSCPYHAWVFRLDGSLSRAGGVGRPEGFDEAEYGLDPVAVTTFARTVMVNLDPAAAPFDPGPLVAGLAPYRLDDLELGRTDRYEAAFNWKVLVENYSENYHTPFVHSQLIGAGYEYPMATVGDVVYAWDRPLAPRDASEEALATSSPGEPGWEAVAGEASPESFNNGSYLTVFPNTMVSVFSGFAATFRVTPTGPTSTMIERDYLWHPSVGEERRAADYEATKEVVEQDLEICEAVQRTYDGGLSADGVLSTEHERGVHHVHQLLFEALA
jgi:phenylpropionate dioxygenase-like ring-hydroxylating dioxygenase large terminal subunit